MKMKLGIAAIGYPDINASEMERLKIMKKIGYDFFESPLAYFSEKEDSEIRELADFAESIGIPCESFNCMYPGDIQLIGPDADVSAVKDFTYKAFEKVKPLNAKIQVLGSGGARTVPDGYSFDKAYDEFINVIRDIIAPICAKYDKILVIEPLRKVECNIINTAAEGLKATRDINLPNVRALVDMVHQCSSGEGFEDIAKADGLYAHAHVAGFTNYRDYPKHNDGDDYKGFFDALRRGGYNGGNVSIEGGFKNFELDAREAFEVLSIL